MSSTAQFKSLHGHPGVCGRLSLPPNFSRGEGIGTSIAGSTPDAAADVELSRALDQDSN